MTMELGIAMLALGSYAWGVFIGRIIGRAERNERRREEMIGNEVNSQCISME
jgi:hypothetical protein